MNKILLAFIIVSSRLFAQGAGEIPVIFDDFSYKSVDYPASGDGENSIFGKNLWLTPEGYKPLRAWLRWNTYSPEFGSHSFIRSTGNGFRLYLIPARFKNENQPMINSTFILNHGIYASRIRFARLQGDDKITDAYWLASISPLTFNNEGKKVQFREEYDFEWNNWWFGAGRANMSVGINNKDYKKPVQANLEFIAKTAGGRLRRYDSDDPVINDSLLGGKWAVCLFVVDTIKMQLSISLIVEDFDGRGGRLWGGSDKDSWGGPFVIKNYLPDYDLSVVYSVATASETVRHETGMEVDWFLYTPRTEMSVEQIDSLAGSFRQKGISRVNTFGAKFYEDFIPVKKNDIYIDGPRAANSCGAFNWMLKSHYYGWGDYQADFAYRFRGKRSWNDWTQVYTNRLSLNPSKDQDSLQLRLIVVDYWAGYEDSSVVTVPVRHDCNK